MISRFETCLPFVLEEEGPYSNDPADPGGETIWGIASNYHPKEFPAIKKLYLAKNQDKLMAAVRVFYRVKFWDAIHADQLPPPLDLLLFDSAVNPGIGAAVIALQEGINELSGPPHLLVDGDLGPKTLAAVRKYDIWLLAFKFSTKRLAYYTSRPKPRRDRFLSGWVNRVIEGNDDAMSSVRAA